MEKSNRSKLRTQGKGQARAILGSGVADLIGVIPLLALKPIAWLGRDMCSSKGYMTLSVVAPLRPPLPVIAAKQGCELLEFEPHMSVINTEMAGVL